MKEVYFTQENLEIKSQEMYRALGEDGKKREVRFAPSQSALLVLDMQAYFMDPNSHAFIPSASVILPGIKALEQAYANAGYPIIFSQHINSPADAGMMGRWWRDLISDENPSNAIVPDLDTSVGDVLQKSQYDAFFGTRLEYMLRDKGVTQVVICGVMTHLCCETTARSAFMHGFEVYFTVDGTATYNEAFHRATLLNLSHGFATPVLVSDILDQVREYDGN
jgi:isochorismate hydrolase